VPKSYGRIRSEQIDLKPDHQERYFPSRIGSKMAATIRMVEWKFNEEDYLLGMVKPDPLTGL
jgi:hypothetical protein